MPIDDRRKYAATGMVLELDGAYAATLRGAEGGQAFADVVPDPPIDGVTRKHLGPVRYAPMTISVGSVLDDRLLQWVTSTLAGDGPEREGAIVFLDRMFNEAFRLRFVGAVISDIELPRFDGATKDIPAWTLTFQPTTTSISYGSAGRQYQGGKGTHRATKLSAASFRLTIRGLEAACARVAAVEPIIVHRNEDGSLSVGNLVIAISDAELPAFQAWHDDFVVRGNNGDEEERSGTLVQLEPNLKDEAYTIELEHLGIVRISPHGGESSERVVARSAVELYVETIELVAAERPPPVPTPTAPAPPSAPAREVEPPPPGRRLPSSVAERLLGTRAVRRGRDPEPPARLEGIEAGERWAETTASLGELESLVSPADGDWTVLRLTGDHSLADFLRTAGVLETDTGAVDLGRDAFVEGLVAGAERVYREVQPHLGQPDRGAEPAPGGDQSAGSVGPETVEVRFDEDDELIIIHTAAGNELTLSEDATSLSLRDQHANVITFGEDGISIQSARDLTLEAAGTLAISGRIVDLRAQARLKAEGAAAVDLKAGGEMTIKGAKLSIN